jgi:four helix bundle protein
MPVGSFKDLAVWNKSMALVEGCYRLTAQFPQRELYGLVQQIQRAAVSIPSIIAEGHDRGSTPTYIHHLRIALGSRAELETQIELACRVGLVPRGAETDALALVEEIGRMTDGLIRAVEERIRGSRS